MNDFWLEVENIKQMQSSDGEESSSSEPSTPEDGEAEADWLQDTGLSPLIDDQNPTEDNVLILSTLTRTQTAAVQRRLNSYSQSLKKRSKPARDVREVFNRASRAALLEFLRKVVSHEKCNLMSLWNIATIMAPNLFLYRGSNGKSQEGGEKQQAEGVAGLVKAMVHYQDLLWTVPTFLLSQVRKLNENSSKRSNERRLLNFLRKMNIDKERPEKNHTEPCKQVKIRASIFVKDSLAIQLNEGTQAADVLKKFQEHVGNRSWQMVSTMGLMKWYKPYISRWIFRVFQIFRLYLLMTSMKLF
ncbi:hypothetical protein GDO81_012813 [Engystomops pustulosus]|uniref:Rho GTPase activating protein 28 n=1 Tax=Engystomops pustulosus TaxID=76066 RepID=A0AAV7AUW8_ENGPU|nr:hypothetical protein GDO81_012813 [Engystomops pustulosus]KAG8565340.1 hypothetical protein GDO81_012813 [Engystomops pustulosus]KAG8565341.1 hypothetical protein GDO81_012813 [Engystomops pustulosus]